jgi:hypothetical protein
VTKTLFALYDTHRQSEAAVQAVAAAEVEGLEIRVIEELSGDVETGLPPTTAPVPSDLASAAAAAALASAQAELFNGSDLSDSQQAFLRRGIQQGGKIVKVQVPRASVEDVARILEDAGGRVLPD